MKYLVQGSGLSCDMLKGKGQPDMQDHMINYCLCNILSECKLGDEGARLRFLQYCSNEKVTNTLTEVHPEGFLVSILRFMYCCVEAGKEFMFI